MISNCWRTGRSVAIALIAVSAFVVSCGPARPAYFQPQRYPDYSMAPPSATLLASTDTLPPVADITRTEPRLSIEPGPDVVRTHLTSATVRTVVSATYPVRHHNPDSYSIKRTGSVFGALPAEHVAPQRHTIDRHSTSRKIYPLSLVALGLSVGAYAPLLVSVSGTLMVVVSLTLPLLAVLLGVASLTIIRRNPDRYRGKGWAMSAILLGTGVLGLALVAVAALSGSKTLWEK